MIVITIARVIMSFRERQWNAILGKHLTKYICVKKNLHCCRISIIFRRHTINGVNYKFSVK